MKLYEISSALEEIVNNAVFDENGELLEDISEKLNALKNEKSERVLDLARYIKNATSDYEAISAEIKNLSERRARIGKKIESVKKYLSAFAMNEKFSDSSCDVSWRKSNKIIVDEDLEKIPEEFLRIKKEANKVLIKKAIDEGAVITWAKSVQETNLVIK